MGVVAAERRRFGCWTFEIGEESGSATPGEVGVWLVKAPAELVVQRFHEPLASVLCSSMSWDAASRIGEHPNISVHERRPPQLRLASPHPSRNKAFRQAVVTLGHSMS